MVIKRTFTRSWKERSIDGTAFIMRPSSPPITNGHRVTIYRLHSGMSVNWSLHFILSWLCALFNATNPLCESDGAAVNDMIYRILISSTLLGLWRSLVVHGWMERWSQGVLLQLTSHLHECSRKHNASGTGTASVAFAWTMADNWN